MVEASDIVLRLGLAALAGVLLGVNRDIRGKPLGMRTLGLVSLGAASVTVASIHYQDLMAHPDALSRVVQGVVQGVLAGISFIGAGVVLRDRQSGTVEGLTTAATVWIAAALGIACGLAAWTTVGATIAIGLFLLVVVHRLEVLVAEQKPGPTRRSSRRD
jgi:putative Mg2+ transporter-C (MgtC) family protein